jgi:CheY-like chemotaxis protein
MDAGQSLRIFVVDDDPDTTESTSLLIRLLGHTASCANSATDALTIAPDRNPDVLLIDLAMPGFDGLELARSFRLLPQFATTPLVAVTGYVDAKHRGLAAEAGFDEFLAKPFLLPDLTALFDRIRGRIADTNATVERTRGIAEASRELNRTSQNGLGDFWRSRLEPMRIRCRVEQTSGGLLLGGIAKLDEAESLRNFFREQGLPATIDAERRVFLMGLTMEQFAQFVECANIELI